MNAHPEVAARLVINPGEVCDKIVKAIRVQVFEQLRRRGVVVGLSGGVDSSVCAALCAQALGKRNVLGLLMPEMDSSSDSQSFARMLVSQLGITTVTEDLTNLLAAAGCYRRRDEAIRTVVPDYGIGWKCKIVLPKVLESDVLSVFSIVVQSPDGKLERHRLTREAYLTIVAATNFKQRTRAMMEYFHADRLQYAVVGTPNRLEYDQGFFVRNGDGAADLKPIAHLYKSQVYQLAEYLDIPDEIRKRLPTTDTYPLVQTQEEFYFSLPMITMDACLYGRNNAVEADVLASKLGITADQVDRVYRMIDAKRRATGSLHWKSLLVEPIPEVKSEPVFEVSTKAA